MKISIPEFSIVALVGISGSGKSSFAKKHFQSTEVISSDCCRGLVSDDENDQSSTKEAFEVLHFISAKRLKNKKLVVIDATNIQKDARKPILKLAKDYDCLSTAIVFNLPVKICEKRNESRSNRSFGKHIIRGQSAQLKKALRSLKEEGFRSIKILNSEEEINNVEIERVKLWTDRSEDKGAFDIIGDVHGCYFELKKLLEKLGYQINEENLFSDKAPAVNPPAGRKAVFVGDLVNRGPDSPKCLALAMNMTNTGTAICFPGNHEIKLNKYLNGKNARLTHGLKDTVQQLENYDEAFKEKIKKWIFQLISHAVFDGGKLVVSHAGLKESLQGRASRRVREFCLYGETTGETDEFGLPVRYQWAKDYRGEALVVYGHTPVPSAEFFNNTICLDTGCVFGGELTALRYPERELVSVKAAKQYYKPVKPLQPDKTILSSQQAYDDLLDYDDLKGKILINTGLRGTVTIHQENSLAALEFISRYSVNPKWLIHLPPTMPPCETSQREDYLERPEEALSYYKNRNVTKVICEEKQMGSRGLIVICKNEDTARQRFGIQEEGIGICYSRTGRPFFKDKSLEQDLIRNIKKALDKAGAWGELNTNWIFLDAEIMPWSLKAFDLIRGQYAATGSSAQTSIACAIEELSSAYKRGGDVKEILDNYKAKSDSIEKYIKAYKRHCWDFNSLADIKVAPFHILASEGHAHNKKDHLWHFEMIKKFAEYSELLTVSSYQEVDLDNEKSIQSAVHWWEGITEEGGEGMVVKPLNFTVIGKKGLVQPAVKCRGREYLRIIYGPEYTNERQMTILKSRSLGKKRSLALREFALGVESLERFVNKEPLRKVHECVYGIIALESEPVDPRL